MEILNSGNAKHRDVHFSYVFLRDVINGRYLWNERRIEFLFATFWNTAKLLLFLVRTCKRLLDPQAVGAHR